MSYDFNLKEFMDYIRASEPIRQEKYDKLMQILDDNDVDYADVLPVLDWLNAQVILHFVKNEYNAKRSADLLNASTKRLIEALFKDGYVNKLSD